METTGLLAVVFLSSRVLSGLSVIASQGSICS